MLNLTSLKTLYANTGKLITASLDVDEVLGGIMEEIRLFFNPENWSLFRLDPATNELFFMIIEGIEPSSVDHIRLSMGEGIAGTVAQSGQAVFIPDTSQSDIFSPKVDRATGFVTRSVIAVPLIFRGQVLGVIELINTLDRKPFTEDDFFVLSTIADYAAIALANASLYEEALHTARTDPLTGLLNRHSLDIVLEEWSGDAARARRAGDRDGGMIAIVLDLDNFKTLNDTLGHKTGDKVLQETARGLRGCLRNSDRLFRTGGDEFLALIRLHQLSGAANIIARLGEKFSGICMPHLAQLDPPVAVSFGMAAGPVSAARRIIHEADLAMYEHKKGKKKNS